MYEDVISEIKVDEGFSGSPYKDSKGIPTIGYGTKLPLSKEEATLLLNKRFNDVEVEVKQNILFFDELPVKAREVVLNMGYNMGVPRLMGFKRMIKALSNRDFVEASKEMVDSVWYREVKGRAERLVKKMESVK